MRKSNAIEEKQNVEKENGFHFKVLWINFINEIIHQTHPLPTH